MCVCVRVCLCVCLCLHVPRGIRELDVEANVDKLVDMSCRSSPEAKRVDFMRRHIALARATLALPVGGVPPSADQLSHWRRLLNAWDDFVKSTAIPNWTSMEDDSFPVELADATVATYKYVIEYIT